MKLIFTTFQRHSCGADVVLVQDDALQLLPAADGQGIGQGNGASVALAPLRATWDLMVISLDLE